MAGFGHGPAGPAEQEDAAIVARNAGYGMRLFALYFLLYCGFVVTAAFRPEWLANVVSGGINVAIWYGMTLIGGALTLALLYGWLCRSQPTEEQRPS